MRLTHAVVLLGQSVFDLHEVGVRAVWESNPRSSA